MKEIEKKDLPEVGGGAWSSDWLFLRTASRLSYYPDGHSNDIGFRCAQSE